MRRILVLLALAAIMILSAVPASAATSSRTLSVSADCAVTSVVLNGHQPATFTCLKQLVPGSKVSPSTYVSDCNGYNLMVSDAQLHAWCFKGTGYLGYRINNIWGLTSYNYNGWFRIYPNGSTSGWFQMWNSPGQVYNFSPYDGYHSITQICIDRSSPTTC